jgi:hypothetical protein
MFCLIIRVYVRQMHYNLWESFLCESGFYFLGSLHKRCVNKMFPKWVVFHRLSEDKIIYSVYNMTPHSECWYYRCTMYQCPLMQRTTQNVMTHLLWHCRTRPDTQNDTPLCEALDKHTCCGTAGQDLTHKMTHLSVRHLINTPAVALQDKTWHTKWHTSLWGTW